MNNQAWYGGDVWVVELGLCIGGVNFEWDPNKARSNQSKRGVSFQQACQVFKDPMALTLFDEEHSLVVCQIKFDR